MEHFGEIPVESDSGKTCEMHRITTEKGHHRSSSRDISGNEGSVGSKRGVLGPRVEQRLRRLLMIASSLRGSAVLSD